MEESNNLYKDIGNLEARITLIEKRQENHSRDTKEAIDKLSNKIDIEMKEIKLSLKHLNTYSEKWKTGLAVLLTLGTVGAFFIAQWQNIKSFFVHLG